tara:strand:- start:3 stop:308 length:306 start_codon:yes stop_codon:yes gene_type:complete
MDVSSEGYACIGVKVKKLNNKDTIKKIDEKVKEFERLQDQIAILQGHFEEFRNQNPRPSKGELNAFREKIFDLRRKQIALGTRVHNAYRRKKNLPKLPRVR